MTATRLNKSSTLTLFDGQLASVEQVLHGLRHGSVTGTGTARGVLLADEQGTGKTAVSVVAVNTMGFGRILIVCPASLRSTWRTEIRRWQTLKHLIYDVTADNLDMYPPDFIARLSSGWVIVNYDLVHKIPALKATLWDLLICDEAVALKSHQARRTTAVFGGVYRKRRVEPIPANKYLLLTGTPIPNRIEELATLVEILDPDNWTFKRLVSEYYEGDPEVDKQRQVTGIPRNLHILQAKLRQTIMVRCLKEEVLKKLPPKVYVPLTLPLNPFSIVGMNFARMFKTRTILLRKLQKHPNDRELQRQLHGRSQFAQD
jgi:SWI/SNF-related matrix-associated actin-dependent regulator 1 of chromatin subfamily A